MPDEKKGGDGQAKRPKPTMLAKSAQVEFGQRLMQVVMTMAGEHDLTLIEAVAMLQFVQHDLCHMIATELAKARQGGVQVAGAGFLGKLRKPGEGE